MNIAVEPNPNNPAPSHILEQIVPVSVSYLDFSGTVQNGVIEVHKDVAADVQGFFSLALELSFPIEKVIRSSDPEFLWDDYKMMAANMSSGFNYRTIPETDIMSWHSKGLAFDINCVQNPFLRYFEAGVRTDPEGALWDESVSGTLYRDHPLVIYMIGKGWEWGGNWQPRSGLVDYQHFEKHL